MLKWLEIIQRLSFQHRKLQANGTIHISLTTARLSICFMPLYQYHPQYSQIFFMQDIQPREVLLATALHNTISGDIQLQQKANAYLQQAAQQTGFANELLNILNYSNLDVNIKQVAMIHIKKHVKLYWKSKNKQMTVKQKDNIIKTIIPTIIHCDKILMRTFKEVLTLIVGFQYKNWLPVDQILLRINKQEDNIAVLFHILISVAQAFQFSITQEQRHYFSEFIKASLPPVLNIINKHQDNELTYLGIKLLWKAVHYDISAEIRDLVCEWMPLLLEVANSSNLQFDRHPEVIYEKYSPEFFYFHSKKWANRIFLRFIQKHAKVTSYGLNDNRTFSDRWYTNYGQQYISALINQLSINTIKKVYFFQLKSLSSLVRQRPQIMEQYAQVLQCNILCKFIRMKPQDQLLACSQPLKFIEIEKGPSVSFQNTKLPALGAWLAFSELGAANKVQSNQPGVFFYRNINYIQSMLQNKDPIQKELGMCLLCNLNQIIANSLQANNIVPILIVRYIIPELKSTVMLVRARALDVLSEFRSTYLGEQSIPAIFQGVYHCLTKDQYALVRIKAVYTLGNLLKHAKIQMMITPLLKNILSSFFQLLQIFQADIIICTLQDIAKNLTIAISPFANQLVQKIAQIFFKSFNKDVYESQYNGYNGHAEISADQCLKTITGIILCSIPQEIMLSMKPNVFRLIEFIFGLEDTKYIQECLALLNAYISKNKSTQIYFYCQVVIHNIVGIPLHMRSIVFQRQLSANKINLLKQACPGQRITIDDSIQVLRNYIQKVAKLKDDPSMQAYKNNVINLMFHLFTGVQQRGFDKEIENVVCCTALMIYIVENFQNTLPEDVYTILWDHFIRNLSFNSRPLKVVNSQLLGLLLWAAPSHILIIAGSQNKFDVIFRQITTHKSRYMQKHQRARAILGINSLLQFANKFTEIQAEIPLLFRTILDLISKKIDSQLQENKLNVDDDDLSQNSQDYWNENYSQNYDSALNNVDEIDEFIKTIDKIRTENATIYEELLKAIPAQQLSIIDDKIHRALLKSGKDINK